MNSMKRDLRILDSNILVYAFSSSKQGLKKERALSLILSAKKEEFQICLSVQNLAEYARVMLEKYKVDPIEIDKDIDSLINISAEVFYLFPDTVKKTIQIQKETGIHYWDAQIIAVMKEHGVKTIYTENENDFDKVPGIKVINPFSEK